MIVRFSTLVEAENMERAWDNLWLKLKGGDLGDRVEKIFTATFPEVSEGAPDSNPEQDKKELAPLTIREVKAFCEKHVTYNPQNIHGDCPLLHKACNQSDCDCLRLRPANWDVEGIEKKIRGENK